MSPGLDCIYCPGLRLSILRWREADWIAAPELAERVLRWSRLTLQKEFSIAGRLSGFIGKAKCTDKQALRVLARTKAIGDGCGSVSSLRCVNLVRLDRVPALMEDLGTDRERINHFQQAMIAWQVHLLVLKICVCCFAPSWLLGIVLGPSLAAYGPETPL